MVKNNTNESFHLLSEKLIKEYWDFYPTSGTRIGQHQYDGRLPDLSPGQTARRVSELRLGLQEISRMKNDVLGETERISYQMLDLFLQRELFVLNELKPLQNNPMRYTSYLDVSGYIRRDYAPLEDRLRSASSAMRQVPEFLDVLDKALAKQISSHVVDISIESYSGMARFYRVDLAEITSKITDVEVINEFNFSREAAALDRFVGQLRKRGDSGPEGCSIGPSLYEKMLATGEGIHVPLSQITTIGLVNLDDNLSRIKSIAQQIAPGRSVSEIVGAFESSVSCMYV